MNSPSVLTISVVLAVGALGDDRIGAFGHGVMAGERHRFVVRVAEAGVRAGRQDDVDAAQQGRELLLVGDLLQVRLQDDLVDALGDQSRR